MQSVGGGSDAPVARRKVRPLSATGRRRHGSKPDARFRMKASHEPLLRSGVSAERRKLHLPASNSIKVKLPMNRKCCREVLECASPLALAHRALFESGRGLPQSKTLARWVSCHSQSSILNHLRLRLRGAQPSVVETASFNSKSPGVFPTFHPAKTCYSLPDGKRRTLKFESTDRDHGTHAPNESSSWAWN